MRYNLINFLCLLSLVTSGCAVTSGLQTYDLPPEGFYQTENGISAHIIKLNQDNLPSIKTTSTNEIAKNLFNNPAPIYTVATGDVLSIYLWAHPEITPPINSISSDIGIQSNGYLIDQQGYIQFPIIGRYKASGKTVYQINQDLSKLLAKYLKTPDVIVRVISYQGKQFSVEGQVLKGGRFNLTEQPISLYSALGMAGGINPQFGDHTDITLIRDGISYSINKFSLEQAGYSLHKLYILPNDSIYINARENKKIYVMGESGKNQALTLRDTGMSLTDVLGESLGLNALSGSRNKIYVVRTTKESQQTYIYHLDLTSIADFSLATQFKMQSNDVVYVDMSGLARWQRVINQVLPLSNMIYNIDRMGQ